MLLHQILLFGLLRLRSSLFQMTATLSFQLLRPKTLESFHVQQAGKSSWLYVYSLSRIQPLLTPATATASSDSRSPLGRTLSAAFKWLSLLLPIVNKAARVICYNISQTSSCLCSKRSLLCQLTHGKSKNSNCVL